MHHLVRAYDVHDVPRVTNEAAALLRPLQPPRP
jgi:hypothetical protein